MSSSLDKLKRVGIDCGGVLTVHSSLLSETEDTTSMIWMEGTMEALEIMKQNGCELFVVSFAGKKREEETRKKLEEIKHLIPEKNVFITRDRTKKGEICRKHNLGWLIDDRMDVLLAAEKSFPKLKIVWFTNWNQVLIDMRLKKKEINIIPALYMSLNDPWFSFVKDGTKKYEGRVKRQNIMNLKPGDVIEFKHHTNHQKTQPFQRRVVKLLPFSTFEEALTTLPLAEVLPGVKTVQEGIDIYLKFVSLSTQKEHGIVMIQLED